MIKATMLLSFLLIASGMSWNVANAQEAKVWSDIGCDQSQIVVSAGLRCRATQEFGSSAAVSKSGGGRFRNYTAFGKVGAATVYYMLYDSVAPQSNQQPNMSLEHAVLDLSPEGKHATGFSQTAAIDGGDYLTFTSSKGESCFGVRKLGPRQGSGYKWIVYATRCVAPGTAVTQADARSFLAGVGYRR